MRGIAEYANVTATSFNTAERLPAGGYILKILDVKEEQYDWGSVIVMRFDIAEGEQKGFFQAQYNAMNDQFKKWKGTYRLNVPSPKSSDKADMEKFHRSLRFFKSQIEAVNLSGGLHIDPSRDWDLAQLRGRIVGGVFGNREWEKDGKSGWYTACDHLVPVQAIHEGKYTVPKDKPLKTPSSTNAFASSASVSAEDDLSEFEEILNDGEVPF